MKQAHKLLVLVALVLALTTMLPTALAYFTANSYAAGSKSVAVGVNTTTDEKMDGNAKVMTITNTGNQEVFVRVRVFALAKYIKKIENSGWRQDGDWYYYDTPLTVTAPDNEVTFRVELNNPNPLDNDLDDFEVTVVYEATPVLYNEKNEPYAKWDLKLGLPPVTPDQGQS